MNEELLAKLPAAAPWSLMAGSLGKGLVFAGVGFFLLAVLFLGLQARNPKLERLGLAAFWLGTISLFGTMAVLITLFVRDQFQYEYVFGRADVGTALKYKIAGVWSGQQGSFLLWGVCSALFGIFGLRGTGPYRRWYLIVFSLFLGAICGIVAYESPFNLLKDVAAHGKILVPDRGVGLTPSLQNYWVVIHPPTIFLGFGALTALFAYAVGAIMIGDLEDWTRRARPLSLAALAILGLGICMGGFWAYETLGWGGFWAWDPVENVSFVPWLVVAGLVHGFIVQTTRRRWYAANLWLAALPFLLFVYGTFLTRSGLLTDVSVHSFAQMDKHALNLLVAFLLTTIFGFLALYLWKGRPLVKLAMLQARDLETGVNREATYRFGVMMLSLLAVVISVGMSWPVIQSLLGRKMAVVEESLYHRVVIWFFVPIMLLMALAPFVAWRRMGPRELFFRTVNVLAVSIGLTGLAVFAYRNPTWGVHVTKDAQVAMPFGLWAPLLPWMAFLTFLCLFVAVANVWRVVETLKRSPMSIGGFVSHAGLAMLLGGLIVSRGFEQKAELFVRQGEPSRALDFVVNFKQITGKDIYDRDGKVELDVVGEKERFVARPGLYYFRDASGEDKAMVWPHIERQLSHDVYLALGEPQIFVWQEPVWFKPGESQTVKGVTVKFLKPTMVGEPGQPNTKFGADVQVTVDGQTYRANPTFSVSSGPDIVGVGPDLAIVMPQMNAGDKSVALQVLFAQPIYPINLFYKPMTILVWSGAGILFLGGLLAAFYRRVVRARKPETVPAAGTDHAPVPAT